MAYHLFGQQKGGVLMETLEFNDSLSFFGTLR